MDGEVKEQLAEIRDWQHQHGLEDEARFSQIPTKEEMKEIAKEAFLEAIKESGSASLKLLIVLGSVGAALAGIVGGWQAVTWLFSRH